VGHIGSALSLVDLLVVLYGGILKRSGVAHGERDRFILSKGHAALALYGVLHLAGTLTADQLGSYCSDGTLLGVHPDRLLPGVDFSTGSLGHGLPMGVGAALAARLQGSSRRTFVLVCDAECNEGSLWEAAMFAAHHRLANLVVLVDDNGQQALGRTTDILKLSPIADKWRAFGWDAHEVDGHEVGALKARLEALDTTSGPPHVVVATTVCGKGVSFMEGRVKWHYWPMTPAEYERACREVSGGPP
jgi:transketolase